MGRMNKPNNMQDHFQSFNSALQTEVQRIEAMRKEVESREKALNDEKERMMKIEVEDDDVISLNIGGKIMAASRSTLCQVEGSLLASMFSGRWEERLKKDKHENVFLDFNPDCFKLILNYLRAKKIETPRSKAKEPKPPRDETSNYWNLVDYLGLHEELKSTTSKTLLQLADTKEGTYCMNKDDGDVKEE
ncbi:Chaperone dnaK2, partial [Paramuricea clavata]